MSFSEAGVRLLIGLFVLGVAGCLIAIPLCAYKFFAVLMEKEKEEINGSEAH